MSMQPGWYPDPDDPAARRYWDGSTWSAPLAGTAARSDITPELPSDSPGRGKRPFIIGGGVALAVVAAVIVALLVKHSSDQADKRAAAKKAAASSQAAVAAAASASASKQAASDGAERARRQLIVDALQTSVTKDAQKSVDAGVLNGPITSTSCTPVSGGSNDLLTDTTGGFSCIAINKTNSDGTQSGYRYTATIDWTAASYTWHLGS